MRIFAFFLPQFHAIPENDNWWGKGFTEWVNVKNAIPLYNGHIQPKHPLNNNYYNLLDKNVVEWQTELLNQYKVEGLIYYHYYFKGKLLLETPAENLLKWESIRQPFFFCWANHPWAKTWKGSKEVLMPLEYGDRTDWEKHFQYLLKFFRDDRYEKKDNKPLLMLFKSDFAEKNEMMSYFDNRCKDYGFNGICIIETKYGYDLSSYYKQISNSSDYILLREPYIQKNYYDITHSSFCQRVIRTLGRKLRNSGLLKKPQRYDGNELLKNKIALDSSGHNLIHSLWFEWDNTPRHKGRGYVITPYSKELFVNYMDKIKKEDYLFINAWNEWCEGMILEPTEENGYRYLEWIKEWREEMHV